MYVCMRSRFFFSSPESAERVIIDQQIDSVCPIAGKINKQASVEQDSVTRGFASNVTRRGEKAVVLFCFSHVVFSFSFLECVV